MPTVTIPAGTLHYRTAGPADSTTPPVVFVHGFLVDSRLWDGVADRLAARGIRSYLVDWPLGSHRTPMLPDADLSPAGVARMINDVLDALGLDGVTLVGNDTGGAICQLLLADDPRRIGRVVLTNCDAFENFPPKAFVPLFLVARRPALTSMLLAPMRLRVLRHSPLAFGLLMRRPLDADLTRHWVTPAMTDRRIREDIARFAPPLRSHRPRHRRPPPARLHRPDAHRVGNGRSLLHAGHRAPPRRRLRPQRAGGGPGRVDVRVDRRAGRRRRLDRHHVLGGHAGLTRTSPAADTRQRPQARGPCRATAP